MEVKSERNLKKGYKEIRLNKDEMKWQKCKEMKMIALWQFEQVDGAGGKIKKRSKNRYKRRVRNLKKGWKEIRREKNEVTQLKEIECAAIYRPELTEFPKKGRIWWWWLFYNNFNKLMVGRVKYLKKTKEQVEEDL